LKQDSAFNSDVNATDDIDIAILSVRLSVNDTPELYQNGIEMIEIISLPDSPVILTNRCYEIRTADGGHP